MSARQGCFVSIPESGTKEGVLFLRGDQGAPDLFSFRTVTEKVDNGLFHIYAMDTRWAAGQATSKAIIMSLIFRGQQATRKIGHVGRL